MNIESITFIHKRCLTQMKRKLEADSHEELNAFYLYECPECHYFITCNIKILKDNAIEIQNICENCAKNMNVLPDYITPQRGTIYYRCHKCGGEVILQTLNLDLISKI